MDSPPERDSAAAYLRAARAADQPAIEALVRQSGINPLGIHWPSFLVVQKVTAQGPGALVGIGQIKRHRDGSCELASIAVTPAWQRRGLAALIVQQLLRREEGVLYLYCGGSMPEYYRRFGFVEISVGEMPRPIRPILRLGKVLVVLLNLVTGSSERLTAMRRTPPPPLR